MLESISLCVSLDFGARFEAGVLKIAGKYIGARIEAGGAQNCWEVYWGKI